MDILYIYIYMDPWGLVVEACWSNHFQPFSKVFFGQHPRPRSCTFTSSHWAPWYEHCDKVCIIYSMITVYTYIHIIIYISIIEGSLNSKLPTIWRVEKQMKSRWDEVTSKECRCNCAKVRRRKLKPFNSTCEYEFSNFTHSPVCCS